MKCASSHSTPTKSAPTTTSSAAVTAQAAGKPFANAARLVVAQPAAVQLARHNVQYSTAHSPVDQPSQPVLSQQQGRRAVHRAGAPAEKSIAQQPCTSISLISEGPEDAAIKADTLKLNEYFMQWDRRALYTHDFLAKVLASITRADVHLEQLSIQDVQSLWTDLWVQAGVGIRCGKVHDLAVCAL